MKHIVLLFATISPLSYAGSNCYFPQGVEAASPKFTIQVGPGYDVPYSEACALLSFHLVAKKETKNEVLVPIDIIVEDTDEERFSRVAVHGMKKHEFSARKHSKNIKYYYIIEHETFGL